MKKFSFERSHLNRIQFVWYARDGRILRPHFYILDRSVPSSWGRKSDSEDKFLWLQFGRIMFTNM